MSAWLVSAGPVAAATFTVNRIGDQPDLNLANAACDVSTNSGNQCTPRAAIQEANDTPGADTINFNITAAFTTVTVSLNSNPSTEFRVDVFIAQADPSGHGEGQILILQQGVTTKAGGDASFAFASAQLVAGQILTAKAMNITTRDTSEFSQNRTVAQVP